MHHLEPFHSKYVNISFAIALFVPDIATLVSATGFWSPMLAIITWFAIGVLVADSLLAWYAIVLNYIHILYILFTILLSQLSVLLYFFVK